MGKLRQKRSAQRHAPLEYSMECDAQYEKMVKKQRERMLASFDDIAEDENEEPMTDRMARKALALTADNRQEDHESFIEEDDPDQVAALAAELSRLDLGEHEDDWGDLRKPTKDVHFLADLIVKQPQTSGSLGLPAEVVEKYTKVGMFLRKYRSGPLPKAFRVLPMLDNWDEIMQLTVPEQWSPQAMNAATKIMVSARPNVVFRFLNLVLLPAILRNIAESAGKKGGAETAVRRLNHHYFMAVRKSVYKPGAFYKGIVLPLAFDGCTYRQAMIIGSIITQTTIPLNHSAAALETLARTRFTPTPQSSGLWRPPVSYFIHLLLNKKYNLPVSTVEECVRHFESFADEDFSSHVTENNRPPTIWFNALLSLAERYKLGLTNEQVERLRRPLRKFQHPINEAINRELLQGLPQA